MFWHLQLAFPTEHLHFLTLWSQQLSSCPVGRVICSLSADFCVWNVNFDYCSFFPAACPPSWKTSLCSESSVLLSVRTSPPLFIVLTHFFPPQVVVPNIGRKACALLATRTNYNQCADVPKSHNPPLLFFLVSRSHQWIFLSTPGDISFHFSHVRLGVFKKTSRHLQCFLRRPRDVGPSPSLIQPNKTGILSQAMMFS